jgi:hypothetical protein
MHEVPDEYVVPEQLPRMLEATTDLDSVVKVIGSPPCRGIRIDRTPSLDFYTSRHEPDRTPGLKTSLIVWRPIGITVRPRGWLRSPLQTTVVRTTGFIRIKEDYSKHWSKSVRYLLGKLPGSGIRIEEVPYETYAPELPSTGKFKKLYDFMSNKAKRFARVYGPDMRWYLAYEQNGEVLCGLGVLCLPSQNYSFHVSGFTRRDQDPVRSSIGNAGLIERWHRDLLALNIDYLDFGTLWRPGDPKDWKGFSDFKQKFGVRVVYLPNCYITLAPSKRLSSWLRRLRQLLPWGDARLRASQ